MSEPSTILILCLLAILVFVFIYWACAVTKDDPSEQVSGTPGAAREELLTDREKARRYDLMVSRIERLHQCRSDFSTLVSYLTETDQRFDFYSADDVKRDFQAQVREAARELLPEMVRSIESENRELRSTLRSLQSSLERYGR